VKRLRCDGTIVVGTVGPLWSGGGGVNGFRDGPDDIHRM